MSTYLVLSQSRVTGHTQYFPIYDIVVEGGPGRLMVFPNQTVIHVIPEGTDIGQALSLTTWPGNLLFCQEMPRLQGRPCRRDSTSIDNLGGNGIPTGLRPTGIQFPSSADIWYHREGLNTLLPTAGKTPLLQQAAPSAIHQSPKSTMLAKESSNQCDRK